MAEEGKHIGLIGGGNMGEAITGAMIRSELYDPSMIFISDTSEERLEAFKKTYGVNVTGDNKILFSKCDIVILAVKPQMMAQVLSEVTARDFEIRGRKLIISIAAGIGIQQLEALLYANLDKASRGNLPIVRVMPNTPALVLEGMSGMSPNANALPEDRRAARQILESMGSVLEFDEKDLDAVTALSGSGPAYVFYLVEAMIDAGIKLGLEPQASSVLTLKTVKGALKLMEESDESPEALRRKVMSPGGTTEAAIDVMELNGVKRNIIEAIAAAARRSKELSG